MAIIIAIKKIAILAALRIFASNGDAGNDAGNDAGKVLLEELAKLGVEKCY